MIVGFFPLTSKASTSSWRSAGTQSEDLAGTTGRQQNTIRVLRAHTARLTEN